LRSLGLRALRLGIVLVGLACGGWAAEAEKTTQHDSTIWWKTANFLILAAGLGYLLVRVGGNYLRARTEQIQTEIAEARRMRQEAQARAAEMERRLARIEADIEELRQQARRQLAEEHQRIQRETEESIARLQQGAEFEIQTALRKARKELQAYAAELALRVAQQKVRSRLDPPAHRGLVEALIRDLDRISAKR